MIDILILTTEKDFNKLKFAYDSVIQNIENIHEVHCVSPTVIPPKYLPSDVYSYLDNEVLDFDFYKINATHRISWYRQQFIKLFQEVTGEDYFVVDSDVWINTKLNVSSERPVFFFGRDQYHAAYFQLMKEVLNLDKVYPYSFISEMMFFRRSYIKHMLEHLHMDMYEFFDRCVEQINQAGDISGFSEYELYGNYVTRYFPYTYFYRYLKVLHQAKKREWTDDEIWAYIKANTTKDYDLLTMHSWI